MRDIIKVLIFTQVFITRDHVRPPALCQTYAFLLIQFIEAQVLMVLNYIEFSISLLPQPLGVQVKIQCNHPCGYHFNKHSKFVLVQGREHIPFRIYTLYPGQKRNQLWNDIFCWCAHK